MDHAVGEQKLSRIVRDDEDGLSALIEIQVDVQDLVGQEQWSIIQKCQSDGVPSLLTFRKLIWQARCLFAQADLSQRVEGSPPLLGDREGERKADIRGRIQEQHWMKLLKHEPEVSSAEVPTPFIGEGIQVNSVDQKSPACNE